MLLNTHASVTGAIRYATKNLNFVLLFYGITDECILENWEDFTDKCFCSTAINTINVNKVCSKWMMNPTYQKMTNKNMEIKESWNVYIA